jgi:hypothetical protein
VRPGYISEAVPRPTHPLLCLGRNFRWINRKVQPRIRARGPTNELHTMAAAAFVTPADLYTTRSLILVGTVES